MRCRPLRGATAAVSRRWHRLYYTQQPLWRELRISAAAVCALPDTSRELWCEHSLRRLQRVGGLVEAVHIDSVADSMDAPAEDLQAALARTAGQWQLEHLLGFARPGGLTAVSIDLPSLTTGLLVWLVHHPGLTSLELRCDTLPPASVCVAAFGTLTRLLELNLWVRDEWLSDSVVSSIAGLTQLESLGCLGWLLPSASQPLTRLQRLTALALHSESWSKLNAPEPAAFPLLQRYSIAAEAYISLCRVMLDCCRLQEGLLEICGLKHDPWDPWPGPNPCTLSRVLPALWLPRQPFSSLSLSWSHLGGCNLQGCAALAAVTLLELSQ